MWRAVFAFSLVDNVLSMEEQELLRSYFSSIPFSYDQKEILKGDLASPKNVQVMYGHITEQKHKERFCMLARALVWCEGDMDRQEEIILKRLNCIKGSVDAELVRQSRYSSDLEDYYKHYARAGVAGLMKAQPMFRLSA